jgi:hypothetical protein
MQVQNTTDYDIFKALAGNRNLNAGHLARLTISISKRNLMEYNPILVNESMEVIDGQHRLEIARQNKWKVYYTIVPSAGLTEVMELNTTLRNWRLNDFVDSLITQGNKEMLYLREFCDEYNLSITQGTIFHVGTLMSGSKGNSLLRLKRMSFTDEQKEIAHKSADLHYDVRQYVNRHGALPQSVVYACRKIVEEGNDLKVSKAVKNRGKMIPVSLDHGEMYNILMGYVKKV